MSPAGTIHAAVYTPSYYHNDGGSDSTRNYSASKGNVETGSNNTFSTADNVSSNYSGRVSLSSISADMDVTL